MSLWSLVKRHRGLGFPLDSLLIVSSSSCCYNKSLRRQAIRAVLAPYANQPLSLLFHRNVCQSHPFIHRSGSAGQSWQYVIPNVMVFRDEALVAGPSGPGPGQKQSIDVFL